MPVPDATFTWEVLNPAAGTIDERGQFFAGSEIGSFPGTIRITASKRQDPSQTIAIAVSVEIRQAPAAEPPSKVNLYPQAVSLRPGDSIEFRALVLDSQGNLYETVVADWTGVPVGRRCSPILRTGWVEKDRLLHTQQPTDRDDRAVIRELVGRVQEHGLHDLVYSSGGVPAARTRNALGIPKLVQERRRGSYMRCSKGSAGARRVAGPAQRRHQNAPPGRRQMNGVASAR